MKNFLFISILCLAVLVYSTHTFSQNNNNGVLLYSQTQNPGISYILSAYYGIGHNWNGQIADDFIAIEQLSIDHIIVSGQYSDTYVFAEGFNIYFYINNNNKPDSLFYFAVNQPYSSENGLFTIELESPVELLAGNYWISVQAVLDWDSFAYETWSWSQITGNYNLEAQYRSQTIGSSCSSWNPVSTCWNVPGTDMYFELYGTLLVPVEDEVTFLSTFSLEQNYPNPFNPSTTISWQSPVSSHQTLKIYDVLGNEVATLVNEYKPAGKYEVEFNSENLPSGTYFYQLTAGSFVETKKMILLR